MIYLDYAAHTPVVPAVLEEFCRIEANFCASPMSSHFAGQSAKKEFERITKTIKNLLNADDAELNFTSGATEANRLAIMNLVQNSRHKGRHIITTCLEHPSVTGLLADLKNQGYEVELADILVNGTIDLEHLTLLLRDDTVLLTLPWIDSELGAIQPIKAVTNLLKNYANCCFHVDAAQAVGKIPINFSGIDSLSFSPHKFYGICGIGGLLTAKMLNGHKGTPPLALAASACKALELAKYQKIEWRNIVIEALKDEFEINSPLEGSQYILNLSTPGIKGTEFQAALSRRGIYVSVKSACSAIGTPSRPVLAVSRDKKRAINSWRVSFSHLTTKEEIEKFVEVCKEIKREKRV